MEKIKLPSAHQINDEVDIDFLNSKYLRSCRVAGVKFTNRGKVFYDIEIPVGFDDGISYIENVDSVFIRKPILI